MAGYSGKPLIDKLGLRPGMTAYFHGVPENYFVELGELPANVFKARKLNRPMDFMHVFYTDRAKLQADTLLFQQYLEPNGILWVSWPKKTAAKEHGITTDITEQVLRDVLLPLNLVDVKVAAIDHTWSGLKFVWRRH